MPIFYVAYMRSINGTNQSANKPTLNLSDNYTGTSAAQEFVLLTAEPQCLTPCLVVRRRVNEIHRYADITGMLIAVTTQTSTNNGADVITVRPSQVVQVAVKRSFSFSLSHTHTCIHTDLGKCTK